MPTLLPTNPPDRHRRHLGDGAMFELLHEVVPLDIFTMSNTQPANGPETNASGAERSYLLNHSSIQLPICGGSHSGSEPAPTKDL